MAVSVIRPILPQVPIILGDNPCERATDASTKTKTKDGCGDLPLSGVRVLELGQLIAGPFAGQLLGHFGAEVIKIEPPNGGDPLRVWRELDVDGTSPWFRSIGRNKKSVTIDMRKEDGRALVRRLAERSDVVIENFKPGTLEKWGLGPDALRETNPGLIFTRVSGYGQTGPWSSRPGYASVCEGEAGFRFINGFPDEKTGELGGPPVRPNISLGDSVAGLTAAFGTVLALLTRRAKRDKGATEGSTVDVSIMESMLNLMEGIIPEFDRKGVARGPSGSSVTGIVPTGAYPCAPAPSAPADAQPEYVIIGANADSMYERLMRAMDRADLTGPEFSSNQHRVAQRAEIEAAIEAWTRERSRDEVLRVLDQIGVPAGRVASVRDIVANEQVQERGAVEDVWVPGQVRNSDQETGWTVKMPGVAPKLEGVDARTRWAGPDLGAHNREILCGELGLSAEELNALVERGTVGRVGK
ncbi:CoA-transferase family III domain-containing protein [Russula earlei]|uniref:CoA-transferase family III domain-containing protein n=1 Tax=Russula earlei TaxID=71964 RepID=A0ACC0U0H7_9AGAM|nr:CoA-transferase family III domain-containing protein [Russula earlei]